MKASTKSLLPLLLTALLAACSSAPTQPEPSKPDSSANTPAPPVDPNATPQARFSAAVELMKNGQMDDAEKALVGVCKDLPKASGPWTNLGIIYAKSKRRDAALNALNRAVALKPDNAVAWNWLGIEYREAGDYTHAQAAYEQAIKINPAEPLNHLNYGILLDQYLRRPQDAIAQYKQYQSVLGKEDLRSMAWVAELQAANKPAVAPAPAAAPGAAQP